MPRLVSTAARKPYTDPPWMPPLRLRDQRAAILARILKNCASRLNAALVRLSKRAADIELRVSERSELNCRQIYLRAVGRQNDRLHGKRFVHQIVMKLNHRRVPVRRCPEGAEELVDRRA
jgi:hypothetical protein